MEKKIANRHPAVQQLLRLIETTKLQGLRGVDRVMREVDFVSHRALNYYFDQEDVLENLLRELFTDDGYLLERIDVRQIRRSYARIFCLLIVIGKGEFIIPFTEHGISDQVLPLRKRKPDGFPTDPSDSRFFETFLQRQWQFTVPEILVYSGRRFDSSEWILPIHRVKRLGKVVGADRYQVEVHSIYDQHEADSNDQTNTSYRSSGQPRPKTLVLKSYRGFDHAERYWNNEWEALRRLHDNGTCENIVGFHGSFVLGDVFHILLEYADMGTLEDYLRTIPPPCSSEDFNAFWKSLLRVVLGLLKIHESPAPDILKNGEGGPKVFQGWHQDIKPKNILIKRRPGGSVYEFDCKLADLGLSHFKRSLSGQEDSTDTAAYGTRTYGAPECFRLGSSIENESLTIKRDVDIWSLGCVLSVVCTWVVHDWTYVEEYSKRRRIEVKETGRFREEADCFHNGKDELLNCVHQNHNELAKDVRARDYITSKVLKMIKEDMLRPSQISGARRSAAYLCHEVEEMIREAEADLLKNTRGSQSFEITHPDNGLGSLSESALEPPQPPRTARRLNDNSRHPPLFPSETILRPPFVHGASPISNGQPYLDPQGQMSHEHSIYRQAHAVEGEIADSFEPAISDTMRLSTLTHRPSNRYSHRKPSALALSRGQAEDSIYNPLTEFTGGRSPRRSGYPKTSLENQSLPVPGLSPTTPERNLNVPREYPRMQPYSAQESTLQSLQHQKSLPVWHVEDALRWKRVQKDPKNYERIKIPDDNDDLEKLKGRDHVFLIDTSSAMIPHWSDARELLGLLFYLVKRADPDGVDLHFTSRAVHYSGVKRMTDAIRAFDKNRPRPREYCNMSSNLSSIVTKYQNNLAKRHAPRPMFGKIQSQEPRPLSIYIFTDAAWQSTSDVAPVISSLVETLNEENLPKHAGIQFIRFGNSQESAKRFQHLDGLGSSKYLNMDIVDTEHANGNVFKMLVGSIMEWYDDDPPISEIPFSHPSSFPPGKSHWSSSRDPSDLPIATIVAGICTAYRDAAEILLAIEKKSEPLEAVAERLMIQELMVSLQRGEEVVQSEYNRKYERFGTVFANGDVKTIDALKDIVIDLQRDVIENLKKRWQQDIYVDYALLQDVSDSCWKRADSVLMQLEHRTAFPRSFENLGPSLRPIDTLEDMVPGQEHPDKLSSMSNLTLKHRKQGRGNEAKDMEVGVLESRKEALREQRPDMFASAYNQKSVFQYQDKHTNNPFTHDMTSLRDLPRPPKDLPEALKSRGLGVVQRFLTKNFDSAATSDYAWLRELDEAGYSAREIAELLLENISDSPWIHFTPRWLKKSSLRTSFHVPDCAHQTNFSTKPPSVLYSEKTPPYSLPLHTDVCRLVEELCGIGGVAPFSKDMSTWHGRVTFEDQSSVSVITYAADSAATQQSRHDLVVRISNVLTNFCNAAAAVQSAGLCCDSFTVLLRKDNCLELRRLDFCHAQTMSSSINHALQNHDTEAATEQCVQSAEYILRELRMPIASTTSDADLHYCALAAQFLCSAFLSYVQAHVGSIDPFFLDKPQRKMVLLGSQCALGDFAIHASLVELTCLAEMTHQPVFAFCLEATSQEPGLEIGSSRYDVLASPEDCLDTWGPGYFVYSKVHPSNIHAIAIGGGFISLVDRENSLFHWAKGQLSESASSAAFEMRTLMRIGTGVTVNVRCCMDEAVYRENSFSALKPLGTNEVFWETQERHAGVQGGQYLIGTFSQTWGKVPGTTLKQRTLQQANWRLMGFLEQSWGLQVSFCTSVARRVSLRELVTDLFPIFVNPLEQEIWQKLVNDHNVMQAFTQGNLFTWLRSLSPLLQQYVLTLVRDILDQLQYTGVDRQNNALVVAWPQKGDLGRGVKIPCKAETHWAQVVADAEDCATFAYVTSRCLETNHVKCQGNLRAWQNASKMLITEMSPSGLSGQPLIATNATITTLPVAPVTTTATARTQWELEDKKIYYIKKLDSLLRLKVEKPCSASNDVAHLVVMTSNIPQGLWKRLLLRGEEKGNHWIRERQARGDRAELVVVRAAFSWT